MITKQLSVSEFKAHCTEEIRAVENGDTVIELTRHGKKVAVVRAADSAGSPVDLESWIGSGKGTVTYGQDYDPHAPAWDSTDWND